MCPRLHGVGLLNFRSRPPSKEPWPCPSVIPSSFAASARRVAAGRPVAQIAADLGISDQTIYSCRRQEQIDTLHCPVLTAPTKASCPRPTGASANSKLRMAILKRARELLGEPHDYRRYATIAQLHTELTILPPPSLFKAACSAA